MEHVHRERTGSGCVNGDARRRGILRRAALPAVILCIGGFGRKVFAASFFWTSAGSTYNWSEGTNWSTGVRPGNDGSSDLFFGALSVAYLTNADIPGSTTYGLLFG